MPEPTVLDASIALQLGVFDLDVALAIGEGEVVALLGPNGAGKSTVLRCLSGLQPIDRGHIRLNGTLLDDGGELVAAEARSVGVVFQDYLLFDHLDANENVAFGLRARGMSRKRARRESADWLDRFGLGALQRSRPRELSGGQQQRVALARALALEPALLLLDEPLAALDASTHAQVRRELRQHLTAYTGGCLFITHDPLDAYALADRVLVLEHGRITHEGSLASIAAQPRSRYVAQLVGTNLLSGVVEDAVFTTASGATLTVDSTYRGHSYASIAPTAIALYRTRPDGSPRNVWRTSIAEVESALDRVRVTLGEPLSLTAELTTAGLAALACHPGDVVWASVKATEIATYPA